MRPFLLLLAFAACVGCADLAGPTVALNEKFTLAPGESAQVKDTAVVVMFVGVEGDSRCPADAICIQGGDARVQVDVTSGGPARRVELHTGSMEPVVIDGLTITLVQLDPYPFSGKTIRPEDYRATLTVSR